MEMRVIPGSAPMSAVSVENNQRHWTPLDIKRTLSAHGKWEEVKAMLVAADKLYDFVMARYIAEDDQDFMKAKMQAVEMYGEEAVNDLLDEIPVDA